MINKVSPIILPQAKRSIRSLLSPPSNSAYRPLSTIPSKVPLKPISNFHIPVRSIHHASPTHQSITLSTETPKSENSTETKDSLAIFNKVWNKIEKEVGELNTTMPRDVLFLIGAPGSGKGTVTPYIIEAQRSTNSPICMSSLLKSPSMQERINRGEMIDDESVFEHLLFAWMERDPNIPLIIDGFPRTQTQVECLIHLSKKLSQLNSKYKMMGFEERFPIPSFKVAILYVSKETSLNRQLKRGLEAKFHNQKVKETGIGTLVEERSTDLSEELVLTRYKAFEKNIGSVQCLMKYFPFHMINADCSLNEVVTNLLDIFNSSYPHPESTNLSSISNDNAKPIWHGFTSPRSASLESFFL